MCSAKLSLSLHKTSCLVFIFRLSSDQLKNDTCKPYPFYITLFYGISSMLRYCAKERLRPRRLLNGNTEEECAHLRTHLELRGPDLLICANEHVGIVVKVQEIRSFHFMAVLSR
ncbi:hypothetical protein Zmor_002187 [Zophobas morio]|uniref:Uncharacterized protein n=1 Tax=Zophobas morio TaxID=2755281 RepID=A0AA38MTK3_9CUCU|nr:hypothetical protein Zmor_002187 [Zophobas morio]